MDKLTIRLEAVKLAVMNRGESTSDIIRDAEMIEKYIIGDADVPEFEDGNKLLKEMMGSLSNMNSDLKKNYSGFPLKKYDESIFLQEDDEKVN